MSVDVVMHSQLDYVNAMTVRLRAYLQRRLHWYGIECESTADLSPRTF